MENITISNLVLEIKNNNEKSNKLRSSITQQKEDLMDKIRVALEDEGLKLQPKYPNNTDIYISEDTGFNINSRICLSISGGNLRLDLPAIYDTPTSHIQFLIYGVLLKFQNEVMDIQLDIINENMIDRHRKTNELVEAITEEIITELLDGDNIKVSGKTYRCVEIKKGRFVVDITKTIMFGNEPEKERKSYHKSQLKDIFRSLAQKRADILIKR